MYVVGGLSEAHPEKQLWAPVGHEGSKTKKCNILGVRNFDVLIF